jgi:hypothetical protein
MCQLQAIVEATAPAGGGWVAACDKDRAGIPSSLTIRRRMAGPFDANKRLGIAGWRMNSAFVGRPDLYENDQN